MPDEEDTVVRAVPAQILELSRVPEDTQTVAVPRELLELSRREQSTTRAAITPRDESELPVWDPWYGSDFHEEPVFDLHPSQRVSQSATIPFQQQLSAVVLSADDLLLLQTLAPGRHVAPRVMLLMLAALCVSASYWVMQ